MSLKYTRREFIKITTLSTLGTLKGCSVRNQFDIVIKNGTILDGSGMPGVTKDIGIIGDKISALASLPNATADIVIDAQNLIVSPGLIDIHTHTDTELLVNPLAESKIHQGVTTEVSGNCGSSPFPLTDENFEFYHNNLFERY